MPLPTPSSREDFKIVIICALKLEARAVLPLFDATYDENLDEYRKLDEDENAYVLGSIGKYHVALVVLPGEGKAHASFVASTAKRSYPCLELALVVGICGGVPYVTDPMSPRRDIFLGDVIVSNGVVQHDLGHRYDGEFVRKDTVHANLGRPSRRILAFVNKLDLVYEQFAERLASYLVKVQGKFPSVYPGVEKDQLFSPDYPHNTINCKCGETIYQDNTIVARRREISRHRQTTSVHFGLVASGDTVMKSAKHRDQISANENIIAFDMESAGVWDNLPCIVVKGVSDYSDSHKNKDWQFFAAACAAACTRAILDEIPVSLPKPSTEPSNNHNREMLSSRKRPAAEISEARFSEIEMDDGFYLDSLTFPQAQFRLEEISTAHKKTCQWIVGQPHYLNWMNEEALASHGGFFWIKGKPGAGKSTMMKYLLLRAKETLHSTVILSFFFHAQGIILERSVMGMYRSLLHQLLCSKEISSDARKPFLDLAKGLKLENGSIAWTKRDVKNLLSLTIKSLQRHRILILIDAVDECNQAEVKDMTSFFQELGKSAVVSQVNLRICLASRHYPHISLEKGIEFIIEDQHEHQADLERYVGTELKGGQSKPIQKIRGEICKRASGVFLWVVLVVRALNEAFGRGKISGLQKRLDEIPDGLDDLFTDILTRDQKDKDALIFSLQLILFCRRGLGREEFYFAVLFETTGKIEMNVNWDLHSTTAMDKLILHVTKGLAENSKSGSTKAKPYRVRFIHESVRDFLLQRNGFSRIQSEKIDPVNFIGQSHNRLTQVCLSYISPFCRGSLGEKIAKIRDLPRNSRTDETLQMSFPFLGYAIQNILEHSNLAHAGGVSQAEFIQAYSRGLSQFKCIFNAVEKFATRRYKDNASLLYILVSSDLHDLVPLEMLGESRAWDLCGQYLCPMGAAFRKGSMASVRALLGMPINRECCNLNHEIEPDLIARMKDFFAELDKQTRQPRSKVMKTQRLLRFALEGGCVDILRLCLYTNIIDFNNDLHWAKQTPLYWSMYTSKPDFVEFLVSEAKVNVEAEMRRPYNKKKPLLRAAFNKSDYEINSYYTMASNWEVADRRILDILLRQESLDPKCQDADGRNAVHWATLAGDEFSVNRLISYGFDYEHCDSTGRDPLSYAAKGGHVNIVKALLEMEEIELNRRDLSGRTPASWAVEGRWTEERKAMIEALFLTKRVDFNAKDEKLRSPLAWTVFGGGAPQNINLLLCLDTVDVNSRDLYGRTPLILAVMTNAQFQIDSLLRCDHVDIDAQDVDGRTALSWAIGPLNFPCSMKSSVSAAAGWHLNPLNNVLIEVLLELRAPNTELTDIWGHTPTWWAQAYAIVLAELGKKSEELLWINRYLKSFLEGSGSIGAAFAHIDSETIKAEMQRFLEGEYIMKNPCQWNLSFCNVKIGLNWTLEGTLMKINSGQKIY